MRPGAGERPRDRFGRPLPHGSATEIPFEDYAANTFEQNLVRGCEHFNAGRFFSAHEAWEEAWRQTPVRGKEFCRGLAQLGAAYTHLQRGNARGAVALFARALDRLSRPGAQPLDLSTAMPGLRAQEEASRAAAAAGRAPRLLSPPRLPAGKRNSGPG